MGAALEWPGDVSARVRYQGEVDRLGEITEETTVPSLQRLPDRLDAYEVTAGR